MPLPYQGRTSGGYDYRSPTLIPNFYMSNLKDGVTSNLSPAEFVAENPRGDASATATIGGTITAGDIITLTLTQAQLPNGSISASYTVQTGDTLTRIAAQLGVAMDTALKTAGVLGTIWSGSTNTVFKINWNGPFGNFGVLSYTLSGGATETVTLAPTSGQLSGGSGPVICANNFDYSYGGSTMSFYYGKVYFISNPLLTQFVNFDMPMI